jgi:hypothetical protein
MTFQCITVTVALPVESVLQACISVGALTSERKELGIDVFESKFIDGPTRALLLERSVHPSYFIFGESGGSSDVI